MDPDDLRTYLGETRVDIWSLIETAISVAAADHREELKSRRDGIVEALYAPIPVVATSYGSERGGEDSPSTPPRLTSDYGEEDDAAVKSGDEELDEFGNIFDDEEASILKIKQLLDGPDQSEETLVGVLESLAEMEITFPSLKETDIGRHVNRLRKHSSNEVRRLVKLLVRKWKEIVDDWVRVNPQGDPSSSALMADGDSPLQKITQNGLHQVSDFPSSPNTHYGSSGSEKNKFEADRTSKKAPHRESPERKTTLPLQRQKVHSKESNIDADAKLASATKRLQANYKEAENAKKQRTIQVLQEIPKPNPKSFFGKNKGGGSHGRRR